MSKFALVPIPLIVGVIKFYKLSIDGECQFDDFCEEVNRNGNMIADLKAIYRILGQVSNNKRLPYQKFHPVKNAENQYEAKKNSLRIYLIKEKNEYIIVFGSTKNNQDTDINKLNLLYHKYLNR